MEPEQEADQPRRGQHANFLMQTAFIAGVLFVALMYFYPSFDKDLPHAPANLKDPVAMTEYRDALSTFSDERRAYSSKRWFTASALGITTAAFLGIVYYGTSFEVTPFELLLPWLFRRRKQADKSPVAPRSRESVSDVLELRFVALQLCSVMKVCVRWE
jgi:hypothetical protein